MPAYQDCWAFLCQVSLLRTALPVVDLHVIALKGKFKRVFIYFLTKDIVFTIPSTSEIVTHLITLGILFIDEEIKAQRDQVTCPRTHRGRIQTQQHGSRVLSLCYTMVPSYLGYKALMIQLRAQWWDERGLLLGSCLSHQPLLSSFVSIAFSPLSPDPALEGKTDLVPLLG